jgi:hypothetical protein
MTNATPKAATYSVVVRDPNSWSASTGIHQELANCGHHHLTIEAAKNCMSKLLDVQKDGWYSAKWHNAQVEANYSPAQLSQMQADRDAERKAELDYYEAEGQKLIAEEQAYFDSLK